MPLTVYEKLDPCPNVAEQFNMLVSTLNSIMVSCRNMQLGLVTAHLRQNKQALE
jgi:hypothetical protein